MQHAQLKTVYAQKQGDLHKMLYSDRVIDYTGFKQTVKETIGVGVNEKAALN